MQDQDTASMIGMLEYLDREKFKANKSGSTTSFHELHNTSEAELESRKNENERYSEKLNASGYFVDRLNKRANYHESSVPIQQEEAVLKIAEQAQLKQDKNSQQVDKKLSLSY